MAVWVSGNTVGHGKLRGYSTSIG